MTPIPNNQIMPGAPFCMSTIAIEPSGLAISGDPGREMVFWKTSKRTPTHVISAASHATQRHRLDGRCPSGNNRKKKVASPVGKTSQVRGSAAHANHAVKGSASKCELRNAYCVMTPLIETRVAMPRKIQPAGLEGFLEARSVPMTANPIGRTTSTGSASATVLTADRFAIRSATVVSQRTSHRAPSGQASRALRRSGTTASMSLEILPPPEQGQEGCRQVPSSDGLHEIHPGTVFTFCLCPGLMTTWNP
jgi:hypothetical protein